MSDIRHIAGSPRRADLFATAAFERRVTIWSFAQRKQIAEFDTALDFGGRRLALLASEPPLLVAGAYHRHGVCAYDARTGALLWQRKDLKRVQRVRSFPDDRAIAVGREEAPLALLDPLSGETIQTLRGAVDLVASPYAPVCLVVQRRGEIELRSTEDWRCLWKRSLASFAVLDAAFSADGVVVAEAAGPMRGFSLDGNERWSRKLPDTHVLQTSWEQTGGSWFGIEWSFQHGGPKRLIQLDPAGQLIAQAIVGDVAETEFLGGGQYLVTSAGVLLQLPVAEPSWVFAT